MSLKKKAISGLIWTFSQQFSTQIISFVVSIILARILAPSEFGLIGMLGVFINLGRTLMDSGLTSSLIRTVDADQKDYSTVFFINVIGSIFFYFLLFFTAPLIAAFYNQEILKDIIRVYALTFIIQAFAGVQTTRLTKEMNFKIQMIIQIPSLVGGGIIGIVLSKLGYGVWSLVYMSLFQSMLSTIQYWVYSKWRPSFKFYKDRFKHHFDFGYKMTLSNLVQSLYNNTYTLVIGKFFSAAQVGYYTRSFGLRQLPIANLTTALNKVSYPMFSSITDDEVKLKAAYKKVMQQLVFLLTPLLVLLTVVAEPFISVLLTDKWLPAVPYFQILCIAGIFYPTKFNLNILKVKGRSDLMVKLESVKKAYSIAAIIFSIQYGILGVLYCQLVLDIVEFFLNSSYCGRLINYSLKEQMMDFFPMMLLGGFIGILSWLFDVYILVSYNISDVGRIIIISIFFILIYIVLNVLFKNLVLKEFQNILKEMFSKHRINTYSHNKIR